LLPLLLVLGAYALGSIPSSYWLGRAVFGVDLRQVGSGNLGATNTYRALGWKPALGVFGVDVFKGWAPVVGFPALLPAGASAAWPFLFGGAAILGHVFSVWVGSKGGKGVATSTGVFLALAPAAVGIAFLVWGVTVAWTRYVSLGSILAALVLPVALLLTPHAGGRALWVFTLALSGFVVFAHRANVRRLMAGTENRIGRSSAPPPTRHGPSA
jgi:acyl phosphate:glycerol-3-phosphate acyltransferase